MPELLIELFSEEIPARMQARGAQDLERLVCEALAPLNPRDATAFAGPRRIALSLTVDATVPGGTVNERGPRESAPEKALAGFMRKHGVERDALVAENGFWVLHRDIPAIPAAQQIAAVLPGLLRRFPWPKSMRWGVGSAFTWVRPLRRIVCILDGAVVDFTLAEGEDNGHGLKAGNLTEGHRFTAPGAFTVASTKEWLDGLRAHQVEPDAATRRTTIAEGVASLAAEEGLSVVADPGLIDEVAGLTEWPVPFLGQIDDEFMTLPPEVMQVSMRVNQRYFALRNADGSAAPRFAFVANLLPRDGGALTIAGNERVLRARFADARHFWDLDRARTLESRVPALDRIVFHASLGSQSVRVQRIVRLAGLLAPLTGADKAQAERAALLCKADLTTGMVGEFPELQGIMGAYYARHDGEPDAVANAIGAHYMPRGPHDDVPHAPVSVTVALADKIDMLVAFFAVGEKPGGSGDPYALRRAALGVIRIIRENGLRLDLARVFWEAAQGLPEALRLAPDLDVLPEFVADRLRVQLRGEGARHDILAAVSVGNTDTDIVRLLARAKAIADMLETEDGRNMLAATKRAANILRIEDRKDGPHEGTPNPALYTQPEEKALADQLHNTIPVVGQAITQERYEDAMRDVAALRPALDQFFDKVTVNDTDPAVRANRLRLLSELRRMTVLIADFSQIEG
ncbi:glycine--tRNA ligase subunit beta [Komagataeibacter intermedius]|uniref:Glycine--tRNA ligase beta subunit n=2 Tax=Komagataeibacter intermedius TaxID=66229 RepID=A0A0N1F9P5_9PROT|nr:glycine--tRNA ligase subunit beta [Komagataeibacter intermedius]KPH87459.1 glycyl-tRNA synthetase subunit beta [Komagataeibacter intermedius AF2]MCF3636178.1 glycine--tRNA ligase subunit beta [Komagataeibacter intermedius]GAN86170.1 glycyl-tRNA synthetase subunit beta [Komagataeibacter intermedius TF2]GBQ63948.1 glycyl-tRNA synthetase subunit beta [Komagataeibacter intermedius NRIC 0521]